MADQHDWHLIDIERGLEVRQTTVDGEPNRWEVRTPFGSVVALDDEAFNQLRAGGELPEELR